MVSEPDTWTWPDAYDAPCPPADGWMGNFLDNGETYPPNRPWTQYVQRIELAGRTWSYATDRRSAFYIADYGAEAGANIRAMPGRYRQFNDNDRRLVTDYLLKPLHFDFECDLLDLLAFTGPFELQPCPQCPGPTPEECIGCPECDYTGKVWPEKQAVRLRWPGRWFDPNRLSQLLTPMVPLGVKRIRCGFLLKSLEPDQQPLAIETISTDDGRPPWIRAIVMGMLRNVFRSGQREEVNRDLGSPRYLPGIGALWHNRGRFEMPLKDWIIEQGYDPDDILGVPF